MAVEIQPGSSLALALNGVIQPKLEEAGWAGADDNDLAEYIILMLVNGKAESEIVTELGGLLGLGPEDQSAQDLAPWLFQQVNVLSAQYSGRVGEEIAAQASVPANNVQEEMEVDSGAENGVSNVPTGPKAMREGTDTRGGRGKRMLNQLSKNMDRTTDATLHRIRGASGNERISRTPPAGPRMGTSIRGARATNGRAANIAHGLTHMNGLNNMNGMNPMMGVGMQNWPAGMNSPTTPDIMHTLQAQSALLEQMQQQLLMQQNGGAHNNNTRGRGKSLFERTRGSTRGRGGKFGHSSTRNGDGSATDNDVTIITTSGNGEDADMSMSDTKQDPSDTTCKFNLRCTNKDCPFAHQSPAAPPGTNIDISDTCSFGAACKNHKCTARHPSPATKVAHQSEQECKFWPNCANPRCTFKHPNKPLCRNGGDCKLPGCEFTHTGVMCKFRPCTNRYCTFKHEEGQRGAFPDKVWTADGKGGGGEHVSERKFAGEGEPTEEILPGDGSAGAGAGAGQMQNEAEMTGTGTTVAG